MCTDPNLHAYSMDRYKNPFCSRILVLIKAEHVTAGLQFTQVQYLFAIYAKHTV